MVLYKAVSFLKTTQNNITSHTFWIFRLRVHLFHTTNFTTISLRHEFGQFTTLFVSAYQLEGKYFCRLLFAFFCISDEDRLFLFPLDGYHFSVVIPNATLPLNSNKDYNMTRICTQIRLPSSLRILCDTIF